jgi:hypothetical protein
VSSALRGKLVFERCGTAENRIGANAGGVRLPAGAGEPARGRVGFHTPDDAADDDQGWCDACERVRAREGEWNDRSEADADIRLICLDCFDQAQRLNRAM